MNEHPKSAYNSLKDLADDLVIVGEMVKDYKEGKLSIPSSELQPIIKAIFDLNQRIDDLEARLERRCLPPPPLREQKVEEKDPKPITEIMSEMDRKIRETLQKCAGNRRLAAEELGISERTLYRKLPPEYRKK